MSKTLFIIVPCYNEEEVLTETTKELSQVLLSLEEKQLIKRGRIVYVDDGSKDSTWRLIESFSAENQYISGLKLAHNVGHQQALWAGLEYASTRCDAAISIDADLQDDINVIQEMVEDFNQGVDIVYGVRRERKTDTYFKRHSAQLFYKLMKSMGSDVIYNHADFRLMSQKALQALISYPERNLFLRGIVYLMGFRTAIVYYDRKERFAGESKYPLSKMLNFAMDGITSFSVKPLQFIVLSGFVFIFISLIAIGYGLYSYWAGSTTSGWTSLIVSLWFIGGCILVAIGIIGEYIGKIYKEVKRRPRYFIEKITQNK